MQLLIIAKKATKNIKDIGHLNKADMFMVMYTENPKTNKNRIHIIFKHTWNTNQNDNIPVHEVCPRRCQSVDIIDATFSDYKAISLIFSNKNKLKNNFRGKIHVSK